MFWVSLDKYKKMERAIRDILNHVINNVWQCEAGRPEWRVGRDRAGEETKMADCIFCSIANHDIPTDPIYEDELIIAFNDLEPQAPVHFLVVPKKHIESLDAATDEDSELISHIMLTIPKLAAEQGLDAGYRVVINTGDEGGQTVKHLHFHILGKRKMTWPPG